MDDRFLHEFRRDPPPAFARRLRAALREKEAEAGPGRRSAPRWAAAAAAVAAVSLAFTFPSVRAGAQAFLDMFRVTSVVGVSVDTASFHGRDLSGLDLPRMLGGQVEVLSEPGEPKSFATLEEAGAAAGLHAREPSWMPVGWERAQIEVTDGHAFRVTVSAANIQLLLDELGLDDLSVPVGLDGQPATVRVPAVVETTYRNGGRRVRLWQGRSPEVAFPAGLDLPALAEIGLRVLGLDRDEAYRLAGTIDWRSTLLVPVPAEAAAFRRIDVAGAEGLMIEPADGGDRMIFWAADDNVYAIAGTVSAAELIDMARTAQ